MLLFLKNGKLNENDDKTNVKFDFTVPENIKKLIVNYSYNPKTVSDEERAIKTIGLNLAKYGMNPTNASSFMPVKNLITLSFDECRKYRGACHRQPNEQIIEISETNSTPGIINRKISSGIWDVVLNVHFIGCEVDYTIEINGEENE